MATDRRPRTRGLFALASLLSLTIGLSIAGECDSAAQAQTKPPVRPVPRPTARPVTPPVAVPHPLDAGNAFRTFFGIELATNLLRSADADERLRGVERAAALGTPEARILLTQALANPPDRATDSLAGAARRDGRALVAATRGLSRALLEEVRSGRPNTTISIATPDGGRVDGPRTLGLINALVPILEASATGSSAGTRPELLDLARGIAARALALSGDPRAIEALVKAARELDAGRPAAVAAMSALRARVFRSGAVDLLVPPNLSPQVITLAGEISDLRALEPLQLAVRASDARTRAAAILALTNLGAPAAADPARSLLRDPDPFVRLAAGGALVKVGAPDAAPVVAALLGDDTTAERAMALADDVESAEVDRALFERARRPGDDVFRKRAVLALSRHRAEGAAVALASLASDSLLRSDAVGALARSRAKGATVLLVALAKDPATRRLGVRALAYRVLVHGVDREATLEAAKPLATTGDVADRALYMFVNVALGVFSVETGLAERDAEARVAVVMGSLARLDERTCRALTARRVVETDPAVRTLLAVSFSCAGGAEGTSSGELWSRTREGGPDAPLSLLVLGARTHERDSGEIYDFLTSQSSLLRSHLASGLRSSTREDAPGRLARALLYEPDAAVRRALVRSLADHGSETPSAREALETIALFDPDDAVRSLAETVREGGVIRKLSAPRETAWLRLATREGESGGPELASVATSDGVALPIAFDRDGFAVVGGLPPGAIHLHLAPRLPRLQAP